MKRIHFSGSGGGSADAEAADAAVKSTETASLNATTIQASARDSDLSQQAAAGADAVSRISRFHIYGWDSLLHFGGSGSAEAALESTASASLFPTEFRNWWRMKKRT